jgi:prepilin-type processing-associated H-X9-DG protein
MEMGGVSGLRVSHNICQLKAPAHGQLEESEQQALSAQRAGRKCCQKVKSYRLTPLLLFGTALWTWISFPATRHNAAGTVSLADGHVGAWRWREANTLHMAGLNTWTVLQPAAPNTDRDLGRFFAAIPQKVPIP